MTEAYLRKTWEKGQGKWDEVCISKRMNILSLTLMLLVANLANSK